MLKLTTERDTYDKIHKASSCPQSPIISVTPSLFPSPDSYKPSLPFKNFNNCFILPYSHKPSLKHYRYTSQHYSRRSTRLLESRNQQHTTDLTDINQEIRLRRAHIPAFIAKHRLNQHKSPKQDLNIFEKTMRSRDCSPCSADLGRRGVLDLYARSEPLSDDNFNLWHKRTRVFTPSSKFHKSNTCDIFKYVKSNDIKGLRNLLKKDKSAIHKLDVTGGTALHLSVKLNNLEMVELLISQGSEIRALDLLNRSPIDIAIEKDLDNIYQYLLRESGDFKLRRLKPVQVNLQSGKKGVRLNECKVNK